MNERKLSILKDEIGNPYLAIHEQDIKRPVVILSPHEFEEMINVYRNHLDSQGVTWKNV